VTPSFVLTSPVAQESSLLDSDGWVGDEGAGEPVSNRSHKTDATEKTHPPIRLQDSNVQTRAWRMAECLGHRGASLLPNNRWTDRTHHKKDPTLRPTNPSSSFPVPCRHCPGHQRPSSCLAGILRLASKTGSSNLVLCPTFARTSGQESSDWRRVLGSSVLITVARTEIYILDSDDWQD
jgi:hypothetical protein